MSLVGKQGLSPIGTKRLAVWGSILSKLPGPENLSMEGESPRLRVQISALGCFFRVGGPVTPTPSMRCYIGTLPPYGHNDLTWVLSGARWGLGNTGFGCLSVGPKTPCHCVLSPVLGSNQFSLPSSRISFWLPAVLFLGSKVVLSREEQDVTLCTTLLENSTILWGPH